MHLRGAHRTGHYCDYLSELEEVDLHTPKPPKWHIKHELNAHLSTSTLADSSPLVSSKRWFFNLSTTSYLEFIILIVSMTVQRYEKNLRLPNNLTHFNNFLDFYILNHVTHMGNDGNPQIGLLLHNLTKRVGKCLSIFFHKPTLNF